MSKNTTKKTQNFAKTSKQVENTVLGRVDWGSKKVQLLLVVLVFALIGGVYYVYKSSANAPIAREMSTSVAGTRHVVDKASSNKRGHTVSRLNHWESFTWRPNIRPAQNRWHKVCALVRSDKGKSTTFRIDGFPAMTVSNYLNYEERCFTYSGSPGSRLNTITFRNTGSNPIYVGLLAIYQL